MLKQEPIDWDAFRILQERYLNSTQTFYREASEFAMDRCLASSTRKAKGLQLAKDFLRDGRRAARWVNKITDFDPGRHFADATTSRDEQGDRIPSQEYTHVLSSFLTGLSSREKEILILSFKGVSYQVPLLRRHTKITARTFRQVLTAMRKKIKSNPSLKKAFYLAINVWGYASSDFISLINNNSN
jgi:hypothetical protein